MTDTTILHPMATGRALPAMEVVVVAVMEEVLRLHMAEEEVEVEAAMVDLPTPMVHPQGVEIMGVPLVEEVMEEVNQIACPTLDLDLEEYNGM